MGTLISYPGGYRIIIPHAGEGSSVFYNMPRVFLGSHFISTFGTTEFIPINFIQVESVRTSGALKLDFVHWSILH